MTMLTHTSKKEHKARPIFLIDTRDDKTRMTTALPRCGVVVDPVLATIAVCHGEFTGFIMNAAMVRAPGAQLAARGTKERA